MARDARTVLRLVFLGSTLTMLHFGCASSSGTTEEQQPASNVDPALLNTAVLGARGMTCENCPKTVRAALDKVGGVQGFKASLAAQTVTVTYERATGRLEAYVKAINDAGFASAVVDPGKP